MVGDILQPTHLVFVLIVALLVLGPKKLPEVGRQLGNGLRDFRNALNGERSEPEAVQAPYEQPTYGTPAEHEFAHTSEAAVDEHEFSHEPETVADEHGAEDGAKPSDGHEFAYETSDSSDKRTDPLA
jgi:sec-independent protein translocase protein TatA